MADMHMIAAYAMEVKGILNLSEPNERRVFIKSIAKETLWSCHVIPYSAMNPRRS